jgi:hypothetical protein
MKPSLIAALTALLLSLKAGAITVETLSSSDTSITITFSHSWTGPVETIASQSGQFDQGSWTHGFLLAPTVPFENFHEATLTLSFRPTWDSGANAPVFNYTTFFGFDYTGPLAHLNGPQHFAATFPPSNLAGTFPGGYSVIDALGARWLFNGAVDSTIDVAGRSAITTFTMTRQNVPEASHSALLFFVGLSAVVLFRRIHCT